MAVYDLGDGSSPPPNAVDPGTWARLMGYVGNNPPASSNMFRGGGYGGGQSSINANFDVNHPGAGNPEAGHPTNAAGQPLYAFPHIQQALASGAGNTNVPAVLPHLTGDGPNVQGRPILPYANPNTAALANAAQIPTDLPPAAPAAPARPGGIGSDANFPVMGAGGFPTTYAPPGQQPPVPALSGSTPATTVASAPLPPVRPAAPAATMDPRMRGEVPPAVQPGWGTISRPNQNPGTGGGMLGPGGALASPRGGGGPDQMGVFNFGNLFGGQPAAAAAPAAQPRTKIDVGKIPPNARAEVPPRNKSGPMDQARA